MDNCRVLVTGAEGMLGSAILRQFGGDGKVVGMSRKEFDILDVKRVEEALDYYRPAVVIHAAAKTAVDRCEDEVSETFAVNTWATVQLAHLTCRMGAEMVFVSSCGIFPDEERAFHEYDQPYPRTVYGRSKVDAEIGVRSANPKSYVIRPGWLFGGLPTHARNFVYQRRLEAERMPSVKSVADRFGSPSWVDDVGRCIFALIETSRYGTYHVANQGMASRFEYVREIVQRFKIATPVIPCTASEFPRRAPVPISEALTSIALPWAGVSTLRPWQEALSEYIAGFAKGGL